MITEEETKWRKKKKKRREREKRKKGPGSERNLEQYPVHVQGRKLQKIRE